MEERDAFSIPEHCQRHGISVSFYHKEKAAGRGPREMRIGTRILISKEAAAEWRRECERASAEVQPARVA